LKTTFFMDFFNNLFSALVSMAYKKKTYLL